MPTIDDRIMKTFREGLEADPDVGAGLTADLVSKLEQAKLPKADDLAALIVTKSGDSLA